MASLIDFVGSLRPAIFTGMKRSLSWLVIILALFLFAPAGQKMPAVHAQDAAGQEILRLVNELRARNGLSPFIWDGRLASAAQNQAGYMAANNIYSHTGAGGSTPQSRATAAGFPGRATENVVGGTGLTPGQGVIWWQNSPIHLNTLLSPRYTHVGIGSAQGFEQNFYALVAGAPSDTVSTAPAAPQPGDELLAPVAPVVLAEPREDGSIVHVVGSGQSFWVIAARYEVPIDQLYLYNNLSDDSVISPGDEIIIRLAEGQEPPPTPTPPPFVTVREGDSWWTIAAWHKLSVDDLLWLNSASEDSVLHAGDQIRIALLPGENPPPTPTPQLKHVVRAGETAWDIAIRYNIDLGELLSLNSLGSNPILSIGDELLIVTLTPTPTATPPATPTLPPTSTAAPTLTATPAATAAVAAVSEESLLRATPANPNHSILMGSLGSVGLLASLGLLIAGLVAIVVVWLKVQ